MDTVIVLIIVAAAAVYLYLRMTGRLSGKSGCGCGCGSSCGGSGADGAGTCDDSVGHIKSGEAGASEAETDDATAENGAEPSRNRTE
ncbi:FeoB-associated Cys-rich membrane protein [Pseudodesulfovibrio pelocollis]|uniref:FeoB-associated Cys-rich membrane protein n=1 Tax=Pseudodesulfovibrio pelocollis TaxID=3051432 RepID=UPI00255AF8A2|nr:FeoB-associated Cys-rich membrane protein [Pseudodesulfovibrio sp. SB368]